MLNEDRLKHIITVARTCYSVSKSKGYDESFARKMFLIDFSIRLQVLFGYLLG